MGKITSMFLIIILGLFFQQSTAQVSLKLSPNNRYLVHTDGSAFFPNGMTCWEIPWDLTRSEVESFLQTCKDKKFNIIGINSFDWDQNRNAANRYGDQPFVMVNGKYDPNQPIVTAGNNPANSTEYDYWDNLEYIIDVAAAKDLYVVLLPTWGSTRVTGGTSSRIFDINNAYTYGQWIGTKFKNKTNIIWMMGGDGIPDQYTDYKPVFRKMAEGVADGVNGVNNNDGSADFSTTLMSYHGPKWSHSSSYWFPSDSFMDFNSTQDQPTDQINRILGDWGLSPAKGTWLFEGGYELRSGYYAWQCRYQAYQTVFSGGFGHFYGHMSIWDFDSDWSNHLNDEGLNDMQHIYTLMTSLTDNQFVNRVPNLSILDGSTGSVTNGEGTVSTKIVATQVSDGSNLMIYAANGSNIRLKLDQLPDQLMDARWFDPRTGAWSDAGQNIPCGPGQPIREFDTPGTPANGNDWVLVLDAKANNSVFISQSFPTLIPLGETMNVSLTFKNTGSSTWTTGSYHLGSQNLQDNTTWGTNRIDLPNDVAPGEEVTITTTLTAPNVAGLYNFQWQMMQDGVEWFGALSDNIVIEISNDNVNYSHFISQLYPTQFLPGDSFFVSLVFVNAGTTTWQAGNNYSLGSQNAQDNTTWGTTRISLPNDVAPGEEVTINNILVAPTVEGVYNFQWQMVQDGVGWFGDYSDNVTINVATINNSQFVSQLYPTQFATDEDFYVELKFRNIGTTTWEANNNYNLGSQNLQDNTTWGTNRINLPNDVAPGAEITITAILTTPTIEDVYNFQWQLVQEGVGWFGDLSTNVTINVANINTAQFVSQIVPNTVTKDSSFNVSITLKNVGTTTWETSNDYALGSQSPQDNTTWGTTRIVLPNDVTAGQEVTINATLTAPSTAGTYNFRWQMVQDLVEWFGDTTANIIVNVENPSFNEIAEATICDGDVYTFGTQSLTSFGQYIETFTSVDGYDSTVTLTLNVNPIYNEVDQATICDGSTFAFGSQTLTDAGVYNETFTSVTGCDSTVTLTLTVNQTYNETEQATICEGNSFTFSSQTLTDTGVYSETYTSITGCDSTITLTLVVNSNPIVDLGIDTNICFEQTTLILDAGIADEYLWSDGTENQTLLVNNSILGETEYYVTVTNNGCVAFDTISVNVETCTEIYEANNAFNIDVYPNPNNGIFNLKIDGNFPNDFEISIYNITGKQIINKTISKNNASFEMSSYAKGIYYLKISNESVNKVQKIIIN